MKVTFICRNVYCKMDSGEIQIPESLGENQMFDLYCPCCNHVVEYTVESRFKPNNDEMENLSVPPKPDHPVYEYIEISTADWDVVEALNNFGSEGWKYIGPRPANNQRLIFEREKK
jgi:hypothetical protein